MISTAASTASVAASTSATVVGPSIRRRRTNAISGSARGLISSSSRTGSPNPTTIPEVNRPYTGPPPGFTRPADPHRPPDPHPHPRGHPPIPRLVDAQGAPLARAGHPQLGTDDPLPRRKPTLHDQRLRLVRGLHIQKRIPAG